MPSSKFMEMANAVAKHVDSPRVQAAPAPSPSPDATSNFHQDLSGQICPDCHAVVKKMIPESTDTASPMDANIGKQISINYKNASADKDN